MILMQQKKILLAAAWIACLTIAAYVLAQEAAMILSRSLDTASSMNQPSISQNHTLSTLPPHLNAPDRNKPVDFPKGDTSGAKVEQMSDTRWIVDRASLPENSRDLNRLLMQARAEPFMKQGRIVGFRITRISRGSFYEKIGLQNGDVLLRANMKKLDDPSKFLSLYREMKRQQHITIRLSRNGQDQTFDYDIR